jgi:hypothetical protein
MGGDRPPVPRPGDTLGDDTGGLVDYCARPVCRQEFRRRLARGRPQAYCSEGCRREAEKERRRAVSRLTHFQGLVEQHRVDVAAFGRGQGDPDDDVGDARQAAREAMREAGGLLRAPLDPDNHYAQVLRELYTAVEALLDSARAP